MIQIQTMVQVADNSGAKTAKCIKILKKSNTASVGDCILVTIRSRKIASRGRNIKKGQIFKALVIRTTKSSPITLKKYGFKYFFETNDVVLINNQGHPIGTRLFGPITRELRARNYRKVISRSKRML